MKKDGCIVYERLVIMTKQNEKLLCKGVNFELVGFFAPKRSLKKSKLSFSRFAFW